VHGDLFVDNAKFHEDELVGVIDFEMASTDRLLWDVAVTLNDWCWQPSAKQMGGPAGRYHAGRVRSFLRAYDRMRPLTGPERRALPSELRLAAARFAISRLVDFELKRMPPSRRVYKDYRHYTARLDALADGGAEALVERALD
jgi:homoserine kinase type II